MATIDGFPAILGRPSASGAVFTTRVSIDVSLKAILLTNCNYSRTIGSTQLYPNCVPLMFRRFMHSELEQEAQVFGFV